MKTVRSACLLFCLALLGLFAPSAAATTHYNGYAEDGYVYRDGYWWAGGQAFTRERWHVPGHWTYPSGYCGRSYGCGCHRVWVAAVYYWRYFPYYAPAAPRVNYTDPGWRAKLLDIAAARDKIEGDLRKGREEQAYFLQGVQALGLTGNFRMESYGLSLAPTYAPGGVLNYGVNAGTQYGGGYTIQGYSSLTQLYNPHDINAAYQQAAQLTERAITAGQNANTGFQGIVTAEGNNRARVAEVIARGQMIEQIGKALNGAPSAEVKGVSFKIEQNRITRVEEPGQVTASAKASLLEQFTQLAAARCASCHNGETVKGGFKVADYPGMSMEQKNKVWQTLTTPDDDKVMPRDKSGGPGKRLTPDELKIFLLN